MTKKSRSMAIAAGAVALTGMASLASGQVVLSMSYENLDSSFDSATSTLSTSSVALSSGSLTRLLPTQAHAEFASGSADFQMDLTVSNINSQLGLADGSGSFTATDTQGNTFDGQLSGTFVFTPTGPGDAGVLFFNGFVSSASFTTDQTNTFTGTQGSFSTNFGGIGELTGALQRLELLAPNFFSDDFDSGLAEVDAQFVPAPGSLALLGFGSLLAIRRRR